MKLVIYGRPTTKKNSSRIVRVGKFHKVLPSKYYCEYEKEAIKQFLQQGIKGCFTGPIRITCKYYMPDKRSSPDLVGLLQASSDILQEAGIIADDKYIVSYDGSEIVGVDRKNPRAEITIRECESEFWKGR